MGKTLISGTPWRVRHVLAAAAATLVVLALAAALPGTSEPVGTAGESVLVATGGHLTGAGGTNWRTDLEVHNPGSTSASYSIDLLVRDAPNASPASRTYSLAGGQSKRWSDALATVFGASGAAALRVTPQSGSLLVTSRTYNLIGAGNPLGLPVGSTFGQFVPAGAESDSFTAGQEACLIQLSHDPSSSSGYRTNIGVVNTSATTIAVAIALRNAGGVLLGTVNDSLRPYEYKQIDRIFARVTSIAVADGYAVVTTTTSGGRFAAYASVVDNRTGDPIYVPAQRNVPGPTTVTLQPGPGANTGTDRGTQTAGMDSFIYKLTPSTNYGKTAHLSLNDNQGTGCYNDGSTASGFLRFDVASAGLPQVATSAKVRLYCIGALRSPNGFLPVQLYGLDSDWNEMTITHSNRPIRGSLVSQVDVVDQPAGLGWYEWNITDLYNQWRSGARSNFGVELYLFTCRANASHDRSFATSDAVDDVTRWPMLVVTGTGASPARVPGAVNVAAPIFVPTSAHSTGAVGTNWRTDLEVYNPGATQASFTVSLLKRDTDNTSPTSVPLTLAPGLSARYTDAVASLFSFSGAAALRITPSAGTVMVTSRTYNLMVAGNPLGLPVGATFGQFVPGFAQSQAISSSDHARIIQLSHDPAGQTGFRTNLGFVNAGSAPITVKVELFDALGARLGDLSQALRAFEYKQIDKIFERVTSVVVEDGYAVLTTSTSGGAFFAYASVIDNRTGDPICVPALRVIGPPPPRPTPTVGPTPTPTTPPAGGYTSPIDVMNGIMTTLGKAGTNGAPTIESTVEELQTSGIAGIIDDAVSHKPTILTKIPNGLAVNYGSGYTLADGTVLAGTANLTTSGLTITATKVSGTINATQVGLTKNGAAIRITSGSANVNLDVAGDGKVSGSITLSGTGSGAEGAASINGTVQVDTRVCPKYPVGGSVTVNIGGTISTVTFTQACDGSYTYTGGLLERYRLDVYAQVGGACPVNEALRLYLVKEGSVLALDPSASGGAKEWVGTGRIDSTDASFRFAHRASPYRTAFTGSFSGVKKSFPVGWGGTAVFNYSKPGPPPCNGSGSDGNALLFLYAIQ